MRKYSSLNRSESEISRLSLKNGLRPDYKKIILLFKIYYEKSHLKWWSIVFDITKNNKFLLAYGINSGMI